MDWLVSQQPTYPFLGDLVIGTQGHVTTSSSGKFPEDGESSCVPYGTLCVCVYTHVYVYIYRPEANISCLSLHLCFILREFSHWAWLPNKLHLPSSGITTVYHHARERTQSSCWHGKCVSDLAIFLGPQQSCKHFLKFHKHVGLFAIKYSCFKGKKRKKIITS